MKQIADFAVCATALMMMLLGSAVSLVGLTDAMATYLLFGVALVAAGVAVWQLNPRNDFIMFINRVTGLDEKGGRR